jgi:hypothetical protein
VPVIVRQIDNPLEAERVIIESNRQRDKTASERMHEADNLTRIFAEENRKKMLAGKAPDPPATLREGTRHERETVAQVAEQVGMKPRTYAKVKNVHDTAHDEKATRANPRRRAAADGRARYWRDDASSNVGRSVMTGAGTRQTLPQCWGRVDAACYGVLPRSPPASVASPLPPHRLV